MGRLSPVQVTALGADVSSVSTASTHTCAVTKDGKVWCWGNNGFGQLGDGTSGSTMNRTLPFEVGTVGVSVSVSAGGGHTCAVTKGGSVWCWGANANGQVGDATTVKRPSPVNISDTVCL